MFRLRKFTRLAFGLFRMKRTLILASVRITGRLASVCAVTAWAASLGGLGVKSAYSQCEYSVTVVTGDPCFPDPALTVHFFGINDHGQACGEIGICGTVGQTRPIVWTEELGIVTLPLPEGATQGVARDINNVLGSDGFGQVACTLRGPTLPDRAYLYDDGVWADLGVLPGFPISRARSLNDNAEVVGECFDPTRFDPFAAFYWADGVLSAVRVPIGPNTSAWGINESSQLTGWMSTTGTDRRAFLADGQSVIDLGTIPMGTTGEGRAINSAGTISGEGFVPKGRDEVVVRSFFGNEDFLLDIGVLPGKTFTRALALNDANQINGVCHIEGGALPDTFLWQDGAMFVLDDLAQYPAGITGLSQATAINNAGQIAGHTGGPARGIILTPSVRLIGDVNIDCQVDGTDLALLLSDWGPCSATGSCLADFVDRATFQPPGDGIVDAADLAIVLGNWSVSSSVSIPTGR